MEAEDILEKAASILLIDWPSPEVPDTLLRAGYTVYVKGGPEPNAYSVRELRDGQPVARQIGRAPERVDVVYCHRPLEEVPAIVATARELGAHAIWHQSGRTRDGAADPKACWLSRDELAYVRGVAASAGLRVVTEDYIADVARRRGDRDDAIPAGA